MDAVIVPLGMMYGAEAGVGQFLVNNLIPSTLGNAIGMSTSFSPSCSQSLLSVWLHLLDLLSRLHLIRKSYVSFAGGCMVGYIETLLFSWDQGTGNTNQMHNHTDYKKRVLPQVRFRTQV